MRDRLTEQRARVMPMSECESLIAARRYFSALYSNAESGFVSLWTSERKRSWHLPVAEIDRLSRLARELSRSANVYCGIGIRGQDFGAARRGSYDDVIAIPGLWIDIDVAGPAHRAANLPPTIDDALDLLRQFVLRPSLVVDSGHGVHAYWLWAEIAPFGTDEERRETQRLLRRLQSAIRGLAVARGWTIDTTSDLARVLRVPGSTNRKDGIDPRPVTIIAEHEHRYDPSDFDELLPNLTDDFRVASNRTDVGPRPPLEPIIRGCGWMRHCRDDAATLPEPEWYAMLAIIGRCQDGERHAHEWSSRYSTYAQLETSRKLRHALESAGPRTCAYIREHLGGERYCATCACRVFARSPISIGYAFLDRGVVTHSRSGIETIAFDRAPRIATISAEEVLAWRS